MSYNGDSKKGLVKMREKNQRDTSVKNKLKIELSTLIYTFDSLDEYMEKLDEKKTNKTITTIEKAMRVDLHSIILKLQSIIKMFDKYVEECKLAISSVIQTSNVIRCNKTMDEIIIVAMALLQHQEKQPDRSIKLGLKHNIQNIDILMSDGMELCEVVVEEQKIVANMFRLSVQSSLLDIQTV
jgi:hypothetical protein